MCKQWALEDFGQQIHYSYMKDSSDQMVNQPDMADILTRLHHTQVIGTKAYPTEPDGYPSTSKAKIW